MNKKSSLYIPVNFSSPRSKDELFGKNVDLIKRPEDRRKNIRTPLNSCDTNLFMGFFFDGTGNNFEDSLDRQDYSHSNVARLYSAYPGLSVRGYAITPVFMTRDLT